MMAGPSTCDPDEARKPGDLEIEARWVDWLRCARPGGFRHTRRIAREPRKTPNGESDGMQPKHRRPQLASARSFQRSSASHPLFTRASHCSEEVQAFGDWCSREHIAAISAASHPRIGIECLIDPAHLGGGFGRSDGSGQHLLIAIFTEPQELFELVGPALALDHEAPCPGAPPWRVGQPGRAKEYLAFTDFYHFARTVFRLQMQFDVTVNLLKKFLACFAMKIEPRIGPGKDHDNEFAVVGDDAIGFVRRIEQPFIVRNPLFEIGCRKWQHRKSIFRKLERNVIPITVGA